MDAEQQESHVGSAVAPNRTCCRWGPTFTVRARARGTRRKSAVTQGETTLCSCLTAHPPGRTRSPEVFLLSGLT